MVTKPETASPETIASFSPIRFPSLRVFHGFNRYHSSTVVRLRVDLRGLLESLGADERDDFVSRYVRRFGVANDPNEMFDSEQEPLQDRDFPRLLLRAVLSVERIVAARKREPLDIHCAKILNRSTYSDLVWSSLDPALSFKAARVALHGFTDLLRSNQSDTNRGTKKSFDEQLATLLSEDAARVGCCRETARIKRIARKSGFPCDDSYPGRLLLGQGVHQCVIKDIGSVGAEAPQQDSALLRRIRLSPHSASAWKGFLRLLQEPTKDANVENALAEWFRTAGDALRIPVITVAGDRGTGTTARYIEAMLRQAGRTVGLVQREQCTIAGHSVPLSPSDRKHAPRLMMYNSRIDAMVRTVSQRGVARRGLQLDRSSVTIIMDKAKEKDTGLFHKGGSVVINATEGTFVVGARNAPVLEYLRAVGRRSLILVSDLNSDPALKHHLANGGIAVSTGWCEDGIRTLILEGERTLASLLLHPDHQRIAGNRRRARLQRAYMFAIAAAYAAGLSIADIEQAVGLIRESLSDRS